MRGNLRSWLGAYGGALAATALALGLRFLLDPALNDHLPFACFYIAVLFAVWWGGLGPGLLTLILGFVSGSYFFANPRGSLTVHTVEQQVGAAIYLLSGVALIGFNEAVLAARRRSEAAAQALRASEDRLRLAVESAALGTWDYDPLSGALTWSERCKALFGLPPDVPVDYDTFLKALHPEDRERTHHVVQKALDPASGGSFATEYRTIGLRDGLIRWLTARGRAYFDEAGRPVRFVGTVLDISERKRVEEAAHETQRRKDEFMATLAHELRNPLAPIRNAFQAVRLKGADPSIREWADGVIERQVRHMARLVDDLMDVSRISRGKVRLHLERFDLCRQVRTTAEDQRSAVEAAGLKLELNVPPGPIWVRGDATRLSQVVSNLLTNAVKFTDSGGRVTMRLELTPNEREVAVTVRDTGIGIEPEMLPRVFDRFTQAERTRDRSRGGLGLGLALVRGLVELHGGRVRASSAGPGRGAEFTFWLPVIPDPTPGAVKPLGLPEPAARRRILIIEDNQDTAASLRVLLELHGHEARLAHTGPAGIDLAREFQPEIVLCDIELPGMNGLAVARALRQDPATSTARLIALSGYTYQVDQLAEQPAGFDLFLTKPVDLEELTGIIARHNGTQ
jgi:PAS domain S-box-containing protein